MNPEDPFGRRGESWIERQMREALEAGDVGNLPGTGEPIPGLGGAYDPDWWLKDKMRREKLSSVPRSTQLAQRAEAAREQLWACRNEDEARQLLEAINTDIAHHNATHVFGPTSTLAPFDVETMIERWRSRR